MLMNDVIILIILRLQMTDGYKTVLKKKILVHKETNLNKFLLHLSGSLRQYIIIWISGHIVQPCNSVLYDFFNFATFYQVVRLRAAI